MTEAKTKEQWARSNKDLYSQFSRVQVARYPPREAPLPLSEWFQIHLKNLFGPFIQKEIKFIRQYQMYSNYCYVNRLPESQLGQFRAAIRALSSSTTHTESLQIKGSFISKGWLPPWDPPIKLTLGPFKPFLKSRNAKHSLSSGALAPCYPLLITYL
ncbi:hypothetical protein Taro_020463 [Colocasia esculenta]|uniref:Uncharacterized protein n=1 Tax=Colocasia esculenta TaxID=4460 RepID=A0A843UWC1_COLES|nr:hypothetical protein [Colocasia esculenta]